jgi:hypothetical protein
VAALAVSGGTYVMISDALWPEVPIPTFDPGPSVQRYDLPSDPPVPPVPRTTPARRPHDARTTPPTPTPTPTPGPTSTAPVALAEPRQCKIDNQWGDVKPQVRQVACMFDDHYPGIAGLIGVAHRGLAGSDHPKGLAVDLLVNSDRVTGDAIAACAVAHFTDWDLDYVLWRQRSLEDADGGWRPMSDRGTRTANHFDHVHISFHNRTEPIPDEALTCDDGGEEGS